ncbi:MAG: hypothetical protein HY010_20920 [Acidobacteria bacterium]|nr:hypothetical protein [Acidobacteriota bacterium]
MGREQINWAASKVILALAVIALVTVLSGYTHARQPETDEGTAAHIFQLSIVALLPTILLFLGTADWKQPWKSVRPLLPSLAALVVAFGALYYLEHNWLTKPCEHQSNSPANCAVEHRS